MLSAWASTRSLNSLAAGTIRSRPPHATLIYRKVFLVHWFLLAAAIGLEVFATSMLKSSAGFTRLWPSLAVIGGYALSFYLLAQVLRVMPVGMAYAVWSGAGTLLVVAIGVAVYKEHLTPVQVAGVLLTVAGVVMLNLGGGSTTSHQSGASTTGTAASPVQ